jgi:hypothetical protein
VTAPIPFRWEGDLFRPLPRFAAECDKIFVIGEVYRLVEHQDRSQASHNHFFAAVTSAWESLPERLAGDFPSPEHLRKYALIRAGFADSRTLVASSKAEAQRLAAFVKPMDEYAIVTISEATVTVWTARSQSARAMGKQAFQASKDGVLRVIAEMLGTTPEALANSTAPAA